MVLSQQEKQGAARSFTGHSSSATGVHGVSCWKGSDFVSMERGQ